MQNGLPCADWPTASKHSINREINLLGRSQCRTVLDPAIIACWTERIHASSFHAAIGLLVRIPFSASTNPAALTPVVCLMHLRHLKRNMVQLHKFDYVLLASGLITNRSSLNSLHHAPSALRICHLFLSFSWPLAVKLAFWKAVHSFEFVIEEFLSFLTVSLDLANQ